MSMTVRERHLLVREFHKWGDEPINDAPELPDTKQAKLRIRFLMEELLELASALGIAVHLPIVGNPGPFAGDVTIRKLEFLSEGEASIVKAVDALRDLEYQLYGTELVLGTHEASDDTFLEVHRSNMEKERVDSSEKAIKPNGWKPPQIAAVLRKMFPSKGLLFRR